MSIHLGPWTQRAVRIALALLTTGISFAPANASSLSQKDVQIIAKAIGFMEPVPSGTGTVAIVYNAADAASKQDADAVAAFFGDGLKAGGALLKPKVVSAADLGAGGFLAVIPVNGAMNDQVGAAARSHHALCVTSDDAAVRSGACVMSVKSDPKVEITINKSAATSAGVGFGSAFLLMAHQI